MSTDEIIFIDSLKIKISPEIKYDQIVWCQFEPKFSQVRHIIKLPTT